MKKTITTIILIALIAFIGLIFISKSINDGMEFKLDYESINGKENSHGKINRKVSINKNNKFVKITPKELVKKINNKETFYVYFGSKLCPWCRSVIEKADEISRKNKIDKVYYIDIWDNEGNEIFRDKYELNEENELKLVYKGTKEYKKIVKVLNNLLEDYTLSDSEGNKIEVGEKRIYAPNFVYIKKGKAVRLVTGISDKQQDSREKLTKEILKDETNIFNKFFK